MVGHLALGAQVSFSALDVILRGQPLLGRCGGGLSLCTAVGWVIRGESECSGGGGEQKRVRWLRALELLELPEYAERL